MVKAAGLTSWPDLFRAKNGDIEIPSRWANPDKPVLDPWVVDEPYVGGATRVIVKRNPYFWQVDTEGNQLPYLDGINFGICQDVESLMLDVISGKIDMQERHINSLPNKPTLSAEHGQGRLPPDGAGALGGAAVPDLPQHDPQGSEDCARSSRNKDFRVGAVAGDGPGRRSSTWSISASREPYQTGPRPEPSRGTTRSCRASSPSTIPTRPTRCWTRSGYDKKDGSGIRLRPDGQKVFFSIDVIPTLYPDLVDTLELVKSHWAEIGVDIKVNTIERALYYTRGDNNDHDAQVWPGPGGLDPMFDPRDFFAQHTQGSRYAMPWAQWYVSNGTQGEEPPESQKQRMKLYDRGAGDGRPRQARRADAAGVRAVAPMRSRRSASAWRSAPSASARTTSSTCRRRNRTAGPIRTRRRRCRSSSPSQS